MAPFWEFLRVVYDAWHVLKSREDPQRAEIEGEGAAEEHLPGQPEDRQVRAGRQVHVDLVRELREKNKSRHTLDIVRDILHDDRVKLYATMQLCLK